MCNIFTFLKDVCVLSYIRVKVFLNDKMAVIVYISAFAIFLIIFNSLNKQAEERSSVPIGIVNYDYENEEATRYSLELINNLKSLSSLYVYEGEYRELEELLLKGKINSLFVIEQGYAKKIKRGDNKNLITVFHGSESNLAILVSDIVAGEMIYQICIERSYIKYRKYVKNYESFITDQEYMDYARGIKESDDIDFGFLVTHVLGDEINSKSLDVDNSVLYRQIIAGIAAMIFSFIILFVMSGYVIEKGNDIYKRRKISLLSKASILTADVISSLLITSLLIIIFSVLFTYYGAKITFIRTIILSFGFCIMIAIIFSILSRMIKNMFWFQVIGSIVIILFGVVSFLPIFKGFGVPDLAIISGILPNAWFINMLT